MKKASELTDEKRAEIVKVFMSPSATTREQRDSSSDPGGGGLGMGVVSLVFGLFALGSFWTPFVGTFLGLVAIVCASGRKHGLKTAGLVLGILALMGNLVISVGCTYLVAKTVAPKEQRTTLPDDERQMAGANQPASSPTVVDAKPKRKDRGFNVKDVLRHKADGLEKDIDVSGFFRRGECSGGDYWLTATPSDDDGVCIRDENGVPNIADGKRLRRRGWLSWDSGDANAARLYISKPE